MRAVVQRVREARVEVGNEVVGATRPGAPGLLVLLGVGQGDAPGDAEYLADKIAGLRIFEDEAGKLNRSLGEVGGSLLVVSQFTLYGDCQKGRRPSFVRAMGGEAAEKLCDHFVAHARRSIPQVATGRFGARMAVHLVNDGPVTLLLDTERR
jgi:D-tyrosyl-tRNA(Tyr) deacylase